MNLFCRSFAVFTVLTLYLCYFTNLRGIKLYTVLRRLSTDCAWLRGVVDFVRLCTLVCLWRLTDSAQRLLTLVWPKTGFKIELIRLPVPVGVGLNRASEA
jgi:hypothetical protein